VAHHMTATHAVGKTQAVQRATGLCYLLGAFLWITNAAWSGWPSGHEVLDAYVLGVSAVLGATLFHLGAMCQVSIDRQADEHAKPGSSDVCCKHWLAGQPARVAACCGSSYVPLAAYAHR